MGNKMDKVIFPTSDYIEITPPTKSLCGSIASFSDGGNAPIPSLTASIVPVQDLHGYDSPWVGGAGKNKFPIATATSSGTQNIFTAQTASLKANTNYVLSFNSATPTTKDMSLSFNNGNTQVRGITISAGITSVNLTFNQNIDNIDWYVREAVNLSNIMIEEGSTKTTFAPYSNICPISGWTEEVITRTGKNLVEDVISGWYITTNGTFNVSSNYDMQIARVMKGQTYTVTSNEGLVAGFFVNKPTSSSTSYNGSRVDVSNKTFIAPIDGYVAFRTEHNYATSQCELGSTATTYEPYAGTTTTIPFTDGQGQSVEVFGGSVDVVNGGEQQRTLGKIIVDENTDVKVYGGWRFYFDVPNFVSPAYNIVANIQCDKLTTRTKNSMPNTNSISAYDTGGARMIISVNDTITTVEDMKAWLANNPLEIVYELATPSTFYTQPTSIKSLDGDNNVFASTGDVCVTYVTQEYQDLTVNFAATASKLGSSNVGSATQPIYLNGGTATTCTYTLGKSVPSDAVFTDTNTNVTQTATSTNANYEILFSGTADNTTRTEGARKDSNLLYNPSSNTLGLKNTGISNSITPSSISLSNSSGGSISIDNTNNKIEIGKSGTSITYSNTDIITSNGNTWDGTNTSLKSALTAAVGTDEKVTQTESTTDAEYEVIFAGSTGTTTTTEGVGKSWRFRYNPGKQAFSLGSRQANSTVGNYSIAMGSNVTASGDDSHAEGGTTKATGACSHAEGEFTTASGYDSHAEGCYTTANHKSQHAFGEYNIADPSTEAATARGNYVEIVGNGTSNSARSNARTLDWSGNEWLAGSLTIPYNETSSGYIYTASIGQGKVRVENNSAFPIYTEMEYDKIKLSNNVSSSKSDNIISSSDITLSTTWDGSHTSLKAALTPEVVTSSTVNLNNYTSSGKWIMTGKISTKTNFPAGYPGELEVVKWSEASNDHYCRQDFKIYNTDRYAPVICSRIGTSSNGTSWNWSAWYSENYMLPNESLEFSVGYPAYGFITTSGTEMHLYFPVYKYLNFTNGVKTMPSSISCTIRQNGKYIGTDFGAATCYPKDWYRQKNIMELVVYNSSGTATAWKNATNNCEVTAVVNTAFNIVYK